MRRSFFAALAVITLTGCASLNIDGSEYEAVAPTFDLFEFFDGEVEVWGIVQNRSGNLIQRFEADISGTISGNTLTLDETFEYRLGDGVTERIWVITDNGNGDYSGTASDVLEIASGTSYGNGFLWSYQIDLPLEEGSVKVNFEDWIWAFDDTTIVNRSYIRKFGITFGEVTIFKRKSNA